MILVFIYIALLVMIAAAAEAAQDIIAVEAKWRTSIFFKWSHTSAFWLWWTGPGHWENKYKYRQFAKGRAFPGSTTWLVWITDGWHFAKAISHTCNRLMIAVPLSIILPYPTWISFPIIFLSLWILRGPIFELFYSKLLRHE